LARGLAARDAVERRSKSVMLLLSGLLIAGGALGIATLTILRRSVTASAMARLAVMANYDVVTGLPNRNLLSHRLAEQLEGVRRGDGRLAVMVIDLDRFKQVNDSLGHNFGDDLLREAGERIRRVIRAEDTAARFGGDEFVLMLRDVQDPVEAGDIAERLVAALGAPYEFDGQRVLSGASVGVALAPLHGVSSEDLLRNADLALYKAKEAGKGQYRFFEEGLNAAVQQRRLMEIDLREALEQDRIEAYFQPVVDVTTGAIVACEALARWRRPGRGFVSPAEFIPLAEETGLIAPLGEAVLRKACLAAVDWPASIRVSVNLSARQFHGGDLVAQVVKILDETGFPPTRLELEITESILVGDKEGVLRILSALRDRGVHIALDDFGTGYSSLSYLSSFPFDRIKVDRSFVTDVAARPEAAAIVRAVTGLAQTLGMSTTAEGVESRSDIDWLKAHGCDLAQGYLVSKPIPAEEFSTFLKSWNGESIRARSAAA
jgi:diguanylate cyclase (GGDEF)-like protein